MGPFSDKYTITATGIAYFDGSMYYGQHEHGKPHGSGKLVIDNKNTYDGEWIHGEFHGQGALNAQVSNIEFEKYEGQWKNNRKHGYGEFTSYTIDDIGERNNMEYSGEWENGMKCGEGTMIAYEDEDSLIIYKGGWLDDNHHGRGLFIAEYQATRGQWKNNILDGVYITYCIKDLNNITLQHCMKFENSQLKQKTLPLNTVKVEFSSEEIELMKRVTESAEKCKQWKQHVIEYEEEMNRLLDEANERCKAQLSEERLHS